jgi:lipopolysaccharide export system protein LptA
VVTQAEASKALGQAAKRPVRGKATVEGGVACVFYGPLVPAGTNPDVPVGDSVRVVLVTGRKARKFFDNYRTQVHAVPVPGLGDQAYYDGYASISVLKGDAYVRIAVGLPNNLPIEKKLAADALPRM